MKVLIGCEESGVVRRAFRDRGHSAWSCDLLPARDGSNYHIQDDVMGAIRQGWDLIILHPPCTALSLSGNRWYGRGMPHHAARLTALQWTTELWRSAKRYALRVALENPSSVLWKYLGVTPQYIQPWQFGHGETKRTGFALHHLPPLVPTRIVCGREARVHRMPPSETRTRDRSETYQGVADAMAAQWGGSTND